MDTILNKNGAKYPVISKKLFWDIHYDKIDYDDDKKLIIERVFSLGSENDERELFRYYGEETIKKVVINLKYLDKKVLNYLSIILHLNKEDFRCYEKSQLKSPFGIS
ncbi:MAG: hypothetical protein LBN21_03770 [Treponema sp.]|jgi:hypothetical protein|nr:hypothetical protein [Treponema sp.]